MNLEKSREHIDNAEWSQYQSGLLPEPQASALELHVRDCGQCQEKILALIDGEAIPKDDMRIPDDFTHCVMVRLSQMQQQKAEVRKQDWHKRKGLLFYYTAAAAITLFLMAGGAFQALVDSGSQAMAITNKETAPVRQFNLDWSDKVVYQAASWIQSFETQGIRRVNNEKEK